MKKIIISALCALGIMTISTNADAQLLSGIEGMPPYKLGVTAGFNASTFSASGFDMKAGFNAGLDLMLDASKILNNTYARVGLLFQRKGAKGDYLVFNDAKYRTCYIEIPLSYGYAYRLNSDWALLGETGPYLALGVGGRIHYEGDSDKFYSNDNFSGGDPCNFDCGWGLAVGGLFQNNHQVKVGFQWGFINMNDDLLQNRNLMISYTYFFE